MMTPSRRARLAVEAVLEIALSRSATPVQSLYITERQGIPRRSLEQILQTLVRAGILTGVRGPRGGYSLARERRRITLGEIVRAAEDIGPENGRGPGPTADVLTPVWDRLSAAAMDELDRITIDSLCLETEKSGLTDSPGPTDFTI